MPDEKARSARRDVTAFLVATFSLSWALDAAIARGPSLEENPLGLPLVFVPGVVGAWLARRRGLSLVDIGLRRAPWRAIFLAAVVPFGAATLSFFLLFATGLDGIAIPVDPLRALVALPLAGYGLFALLALGEEVGWRGFLLTRLRASGVRRRYLATGLVWAAWHYPLILFAGYASSPLPWLSVVLFTVDLAALGVFLAVLRERTGSLWPAVVGHASHNVWMVQTYPGLAAKGPWYPYFGGESGAFIGAAYVVAALVAARSRRARPEAS